MPQQPAVTLTEEDLERNALSRRLPDEAALRRQVSAGETARSQQRRGLSWQFTSRDAHPKLYRLNPVKDPSSIDHEPRLPAGATKS